MGANGLPTVPGGLVGLSLWLGAREEGAMWGPRAGDTTCLPEKPGAARAEAQEGSCFLDGYVQPA